MAQARRRLHRRRHVQGRARAVPVVQVSGAPGRVAGGEPRVHGAGSGGAGFCGRVFCGLVSRLRGVRQRGRPRVVLRVHALVRAARGGAARAAARHRRAGSAAGRGRFVCYFCRRAAVHFVFAARRCGRGGAARGRHGQGGAGAAFAGAGARARRGDGFGRVHPQTARRDVRPGPVGPRLELSRPQLRARQALLRGPLLGGVPPVGAARHRRLLRQAAFAQPFNGRPASL
mmetsp:Transcript_25562/g.87805  ORF Transcript_25562/g.87805 Transcript_25562/m.87805 type:complete len:230 (-) Transcript_25562:2360-3049(-)